MGGRRCRFARKPPAAIYPFKAKALCYIRLLLKASRVIPAISKCLPACFYFDQPSLLSATFSKDPWRLAALWPGIDSAMSAH